MNRTSEQWAAVLPDAVLSGSPAQARNVLKMALDDIAEMAARIRDLERVAAELARPHDAVAGTKPLVLYFATEGDRDWFIAEMQIVKPDMRAVKLP